MARRRTLSARNSSKSRPHPAYDAALEWLLADIADNGEAATAEAADARPVPSFEASP